MKHVTFTRDMRPHRAGERRVLPDDIATRLEVEGAIAPDPPDWPDQAGATNNPPPAMQPDPARQLSRKQRRALAQTYSTK